MNKEQLVVIWRIYEPCNLACHFCEYSREIRRTRRITTKDGILRFGKILSEFQQRIGKEVLVSWLGGEPLLWKELPSISTIYHRDFAIQQGLTTNGTSLDREDIRVCLIDNYSFVTISIDGFSAFHDFHRGEDGLFKRIQEHVRMMAQEITIADSSLKLRVNTILMRKNIAEFETFCMEVADWGVKELTFNQLGGYERTEFYADNRLLPEQTNWLEQELPRIQQKTLAKGMRVFGSSKYLKRIVATSHDLAIPIDDCQPGRQFLFINENDQVSPCHFTTESYGVSISEIKTVDDVIRLPERFQYKQRFEKALSCADCHSTQVFEKFNQGETS